MRLSRLREHYADAYSAYVTGSPTCTGKCLSKNHLWLIYLTQDHLKEQEHSTLKTQAMAKQEVRR